MTFFIYEYILIVIVYYIYNHNFTFNHLWANYLLHKWYCG